MTRDGERPKGREMAPISQRDQAKRNDDEQNGLFVHVEAKQKRCVAAERRRTDKVLPRGLRLHEELDKREHLEKQRQSKACTGADFGKNGKRGVADETAGDTLQGFCLDIEAQPRGN